ncbi:hypothetical protein N431DRAFT_235895 [Stipitochalara longipes BDJ]|nr:hypothetical protein N431DRAFT_235895 [Stipitochalara longipes BDJ]
MEVLVLGLSRTGTSSTRQALKDLGHKKVYHTFSIIFDEPDHGDIWVEAFKAKSEDGPEFNDWDRLLGTYTAVTDVPCAIFWKELINVYPNAKVVLTVRDSTDAWYKSYKDTINQLTQTAYLKPSLLVQFFHLFLSSHSFDRLMKYQILYTPRGRFEAEGRGWYEQHNAVITRVPKESLLVFNVKQGWKPLCKFLGKRFRRSHFRGCLRRSSIER